jgi:hypothetical protein
VGVTPFRESLKRRTNLFDLTKSPTSSYPFISKR